MCGDPIKHAFTLEEFKCLRTEIMDCITAQRNLEALCVGAIAVVYSFLLSKPELSILAWLVPIIISVFGLARIIAISIQIRIIADYLRRVEEEINPNGGFWEQYIYSERKKSYRAHLLGGTGKAAFCVILGGTTLIFFVKLFGYI
jgi:hypothetical protein